MEKNDKSLIFRLSDYLSPQCHMTVPYNGTTDNFFSFSRHVEIRKITHLITVFLINNLFQDVSAEDM